MTIEIDIETTDVATGDTRRDIITVPDTIYVIEGSYRESSEYGNGVYTEQRIQQEFGFILDKAAAEAAAHALNIESRNAYAKYLAGRDREAANEQARIDLAVAQNEVLAASHLPVIYVPKLTTAKPPYSLEDFIEYHHATTYEVVPLTPHVPSEHLPLD